MSYWDAVMEQMQESAFEILISEVMVNAKVAAQVYSFQLETLSIKLADIWEHSPGSAVSCRLNNGDQNST
jgi:hypothetical protein